MRMRNDERGFGLILLIGITAALAILTAMLVVMLDNHMHTAEHERYTKTSLYYAEAALNSAMGDLENNTAWQTSSFSLTSATLTALNQNYSTLSGGPTVTYMVYDNLTPVNTAVNWDSNGDGKVWVQATVAYQGRTTMVRQAAVLVDHRLGAAARRCLGRHQHDAERHEQHLRGQRQRLQLHVRPSVRDNSYGRRQLHRRR